MRARLLFTIFVLGIGLAPRSHAVGPFAPAPPASGPINNGSTAVPANDPGIKGWATGYLNFDPGPQQIGDPDLGNVPASFGTPANALGKSDATTDNTFPVVSLGDGGSITLTFSQPIANGPGFDFAVFENGLTDTFLELAFVDVSSDGVNWVRFPSTSLTQAKTQVNGDPTSGTFGTIDPTNLNNLAGKYRAGYGTPFNLDDLSGQPNANLLDFSDIKYVRIVDVVGSIQSAFATHDAFGHIINDPWPTPFPSSGFDLDAVAILNNVPEPEPALLLALGAVPWLARRRR
jgi:hypothetical protein